MLLNEPKWWYPIGRGHGSWQARLLSPIAAFYAFSANRRMLREDGLKVACPVICVGNFTAGGTGKTPLACWISDVLHRNGLTPAFLSRGYGGREAGPIWLDPAQHTAADVGDEPLLLARYGSVMIARDRAAGALKILESNRKTDAIIMDDGVQNPALKKDLSLCVVDGRRGFGNGRVIPAGPLRATLSVQAARIDAVIFNHGGTDAHENGAAFEAAVTQLNDVGFLGQTMFAGVSVKGDATWLKDARVLAFAGIGNPERFFATLRSLGAKIVEQRVFKDHQVLSERDAEALLKAASSQDLTLVTTEKDAVRFIQDGQARKALSAHARVLPIHVSFEKDDEKRLSDLILRLFHDGDQ